MSNPTFLLRDGGGRRYVLRKKPPGKLLPSATRSTANIGSSRRWPTTDVPVARAYALCEDDAVIGQAFYIMEHVVGRVFRNYALPGLRAGRARRDLRRDERRAGAPARRRLRARSGSPTTARPAAIRPPDRPLVEQYEAAETETLPAMEQLMRWLPAHIPAADETTIVHGDYRLENMILHPTEPRVLAVLDWELHARPSAGRSRLQLPALASCPTEPRRRSPGSMPGSGIPDRGRLRRRLLPAHRPRGHRGLGLLSRASLFRLAAIAQGVYKRGLDGNASSPGALERGAKARALAEAAWAIAGGKR